ncbi:hypothetical protein D9M68_519860 [compost metagenome]
MFQLFLQAGQFHVEQAFELVGRHVAGGHDAQVIANVGRHPLILEEARILAEDGAGGGVLDIGLDGHHPLAAALVEDFVEQAQNVQVESLVEARAEHLQRLLEHDHRHVAGVGLEEGAQRRATDDHHFEGLDQRGKLAVGQDVSAEHAGEYDDDAEDFCHRKEA